MVRSVAVLILCLNLLALETGCAVEVAPYGYYGPYPYRYYRYRSWHYRPYPHWWYYPFPYWG